MICRGSLVLVTVALVASGCGAPGATGKAAAKVVKGDWEFNHDFTGAASRYDEYGIVDEISCDARPAPSGDLDCRLQVSDKEHHRRRARVVVHYDEHGILQGWRLR